jgi:hypothetical protein
MLTKKTEKLLPNYYCYLLIVAVSILIILPVFLFGIPYSSDFWHHLQSSENFLNIFKGGDFPVWSGEANNGYGGIVLRFYPPLSYAIMSFFRSLCDDLYFGTILAFLFWTILGGLGVFFWTNEHFSRRSSLFASVCYMFAPYHVGQVYIGFMYPEYAACGLLPFCFWFIDRINKNKTWLDVLGFGFFYGLLVLTHIPVTFIGTISLFMYCFWSRDFRSNAVKLASGFVLGLTMSSFQLVRIINEINWVGISMPKFSSQGYYNYNDTFLLSFPYIFRQETDIHSMWFLDLILLFTATFAISFLAVSKLKLYNALVTFFVAIFFATPLSKIVWDNVSVLQKVQFPWRWLAIISIISVVFFASGFERFIELAKQKNRAKFYFLSGFVLFYFFFSCFQCIKQAQFYERSEALQMMDKIAARENFEEWLPIWANPNTSKIDEKVVVENRTFEIIDWKNSEKTIRFNAGNETIARISAFYYPHWRGYFNEIEAKITPSDDGAISVKIPPNETVLRLTFVEPKINIWFFYFTSFCLTLAGLSLIGTKVWKISSKSKI